MTNLQKHLAKYNTEEELNFDEPSHRYFNKDNKTFLSVTQFLGEFEPKFDEEFWGMYTALKDNGKLVKPDLDNKAIYINGVSNPISKLHKDTIYKHWYSVTIAKWKGISAEACLRGNNTHNYLEESINESKGFFNGNSDNSNITSSRKKDNQISTVNDLDKGDLKEKFPSIYERLKLYIERDCIIYAEKRVKLDFALIAGMIDVPIIKRGTNKFCITDWKTNKDEFKYTSGYMKKIKVGNDWVKSDIFVPTDDRFSYPISHLPYCKINLYSLQLSLYAYIMECWGYELVDKGLEIIHIRPGMEPKVIKIPYLREEIELLIKHRLQEIGLPYFDNSMYKKTW